MDKNFSVIIDHINQVGFGGGRAIGGEEETVVSPGIDYAIAQGMLSQGDINELLNKFDNGDYGSYYDLGDPVLPGKEKGEYEVGFGERGGRVMINRLHPGRRYCYFKYES